MRQMGHAEKEDIQDGKAGHDCARIIGPRTPVIEPDHRCFGVYEHKCRRSKIDPVSAVHLPVGMVGDFYQKRFSRRGRFYDDLFLSDGFFQRSPAALHRFLRETPDIGNFHHMKPGEVFLRHRLLEYKGNGKVPQSKPFIKQLSPVPFADKDRLVSDGLHIFFRTGFQLIDLIGSGPVKRPEFPKPL